MSYDRNIKSKEECYIDLQPNNFQLEQTTIWSFPERGSWATHSGKYRGNWTPYVPRNLILRYSKPGDWILDQFTGSGTTLVEAKLLNRNAVGVDINPQSVSNSEKNIQFESNLVTKILVREGNATNLNFIKDEKIDLICTHPPYADIIRYSKSIEGDISHLKTEEFLEAMNKVAEESFRVLKEGKICAVMMGDIRKNGKVVPLGFRTMEVFLNTGFQSKEIIIKEQYNCKSTAYWKSKKNKFLLLAHEYIFVFQK
ncbi:TRM11 family SAM-dependent methyltransferase [Blautia sp. An81]|uniref:TRM11 family SAM-dependent methyltransferase n=1 Tax=Blautia sp. An81 TaxID=1965659 RepID=UPI000B365472|nr:DNA methyltransferase [Blautia sp. An81]OUN23460.1 site-specific DNA-methyltransferase [Blautia sp. An81]